MIIKNFSFILLFFVCYFVILILKRFFFPSEIFYYESVDLLFLYSIFIITLILMGKPKHIAPTLIKSLNEQLSALDQEEKKINASTDSKKQKLVFVNLREHLYSPDKQR